MKTELEEVETQLSDLLERQSELSKKKEELETILKQSTATSTASGVKWDKTGLIDTTAV